MWEIFLTAFVSATVTAVVLEIIHYRNNVRRRTRLEQNYVELQKNVDNCVNIIERIIHGSKL